MKQKVWIVAGDMVTPYGWGLESCWNGLEAGRCMLQPLQLFETKSFQSQAAGLVPELAAARSPTRVMAMLKPLFEKAKDVIPPDVRCLLATTIGEIEYLERAVLDGSNTAEESCPSRLLAKIEALAGTSKKGLVISAACSSSSVAVADGAARIAEGADDAVLITACDSVSEFLFSGFSSLLALDPKRARPFDRNREGLSVGEAAGYLLLMSPERARREGRKALGELLGWGLSNDANHMTGPSRGGEGLASAISQSLSHAGITDKDIASISAHGTGTVYNDAMEMKAFKTVFSQSRPTYSVKGGMGHTMAAAGLVEILIALKSLQQQKVPGTIGLEEIDPEAEGWVSAEARQAPGGLTLSTNSGFGGVNAALVLAGGES